MALCMSGFVQSNLKNRSIFCRDNLDVLRGIDTGTVDLIYLDPPFNKNKKFVSPIKSSAKGASFDDIFKKEDVKDEWVQTIKEDYDAVHDFLLGIKSVGKPYNYFYLCYMAIRLIECHRILSDKGSIYLHCDNTMSHYLKILLDCIFGEDHFRNEVIWHYGGIGAKITSKQFPRNHDVIFLYGKTDAFVINKQFLSYKTPIAEWKGGIDEQGRYFHTAPRGDYTDESIEQLRQEGRVHETKNGNIRIKYFHEHDDHFVYSKKAVGDVWDDIPDAMHIPPSERTGYKTQKPLVLMERIIEASSHEGDFVLDPFCGCATTCVAAERLARKWIGIDVSQEAYELVKKRLRAQVENKEPLLYEKSVTYSHEPPVRTDGTATDGQEKKYVYVISNKSYEGEYKVGIAKNVNSRLNSYQTSDPNRGYQIEFAFLTHAFRDIEKFIHKKYQARHEWVRGDLKAIIKDIESFC